MRQYIVLFLLAISICISCTKVYNPDINADKTAIVVDGLITDEVRPYAVQLTKAIPYDSSGSGGFVNHAKVLIFDDCNNQYKLTEAGSGTYTTDPSELIGKPGVSYTLHIETEDGSIYESSPQLMLPNDFQENIYAGYDTQETLIEDSYGQNVKVSTPGVDLLTDIKNNSDSLPRFRFKYSITNEYEYSIFLNPFLTLYFYCWVNENPNDLINLTDEKYSVANSDIQKHIIGFLPTVQFYTTMYRDSVLNAPIINQVIKLHRYRVNHDAYQYFKNINSLLSAQGKIFDPIAFQLQGNLICKTNSKKLVLGFFEASSVKSNIIYIRPGKIQVGRALDFNPPTPSGCSMSQTDSTSGPSTPPPPAFWIY